MNNLNLPCPAVTHTNNHPSTVCAKKNNNMDVQMSDPTVIFNYLNFDHVFFFDPHCKYAEEVVREIERNKKDLELQFVEKVMQLLGIKRRT